MARYLKISVGVLIAALIIIQFIGQPLPETRDISESDLILNEQVPEEAALVLKTSCYDCHSMQTHYPWYSHVAPVKWLLTHDINWGRGGVNLSDWGNYSTKDKIKYLGEIAEVVEEGEMPLPIYTIMHGEAKLTAEEKELLVSWAESASEAYFGE